jgi:hypothetical protein
MKMRLLKCLIIAATTVWLIGSHVARVASGPTGEGGEPAAAPAEVNSILAEIKLVPPARPARPGVDKPLDFSKLPAFSAKGLAPYKTDDYKTIGELRMRYKDDADGFAKKHPIRAVVLDTVEALQKSAKMPLRETLNGPINPKQKAAFLQQQAAPGEMLFELEQVLVRLRTVADNGLEKEKSKRWRAHFDFAEARLKARIVYIYEYDYLLGQIRTDSLPPLEKGATGWRMEPRAKIQVTEPKAKLYAKDLAKSWTNIEKAYPETPWAAIAARESQIGLGLEWQAVKK